MVDGGHAFGYGTRVGDRGDTFERSTSKNVRHTEMLGSPVLPPSVFVLQVPPYGLADIGIGISIGVSVLGAAW